MCGIMRVMKLQSRFIASIASEVLVEGQFVVTFDVKIFVGTKDEWIPCAAEVSLNRTVSGNDNATGTVTDTGGDLSIPIPVTVTAGTATDALPTSNSAMSLRSWLTTIRNNVAWLISNKLTATHPAAANRVPYTSSATATAWTTAPTANARLRYGVSTALNSATPAMLSLMWVGTQTQYNSATSIPTGTLIIIHDP